MELTLLVLLPRSELVSFLGISEGPESTEQVIRMPVMKKRKGEVRPSGMSNSDVIICCDVIRFSQILSWR